MDYTKEQLKERFKNLPKDVQEMMLSEDMGLSIQLIGRDLGITPEQSLNVEGETVDVLWGISDPKDFIQNIQTKIGVDEEKARAIAERVNEEIFQPVKESLKIVHNIQDDLQPTTYNLQQAPLRSDLGSVPVPRPPATGTFPQMIVPPKAIMETVVPKPVAPVSQNIFEQKLQGVFKMPRQETTLPTTDNQQRTTGNPQPSGVDPYREQPK